jgi:hypothetical protein
MSANSIIVTYPAYRVPRGRLLIGAGIARAAGVANPDHEWLGADGSFRARRTAPNGT